MMYAPTEVISAFKVAGKLLALPIHYNTFPTDDTDYDQPLRELESAVAGHPLSSERFVPLAIRGSRFYLALPAATATH